MTLKFQRKAKALGLKGRRRRPAKRQPKIMRGPHGLTVPEAGAMIGLSRNKSYLAAKAGEIPTMKFGALEIVPRGPWLKKIGVDDVA
jgi:hypothetical protein